jgi:hypothetical protein
MNKFLDESNQIKESKIGALKNLHIFLQQVKPEERSSYLKFVVPPKENSQLDWRIKFILAQNLGAYALLFDQETVFDIFLPIFFRFCFDPVAKVAETASLSLAQIL